MKTDHILVPVDFSDNSLKAIDAALEMQKVFGGRVELLYVLEPLIVTFGEALPADLPNDLERVTSAEAEMERLRGRYALDLPLETSVLQGTAWDVVCEVAEKKNTGLIVITSHGYTGLKRILLGSTAERIVRHAHCPVLVVKLPAEAKK